MNTESPLPEPPQPGSFGPIIAEIHGEGIFIGRILIGNRAQPLHFDPCTETYPHTSDRIRELRDRVLPLLNASLQRSQCLMDTDGRSLKIDLPISRKALEVVHRIMRLLGGEQVRIKWLFQNMERDRRVLHIPLAPEQS